MKREPAYWLIKSEGECYSIDDLKRDGRAPWTGVRNFQARNFMRQMDVGDLAIFYHSNSAPSGAYGVAKVASTLHADPTQFDRRDDHFDPRSKKEKPLWECVDFSFVRKFAHPISLAELKADPELEGMGVRRKGDRLSIHPVSKRHFEHVLTLAGK